MLVCPTFLAGAADVAPQQRIVVSPGSTDIALDPGGSITKSVTVVNKGEKAVLVGVTAVPFMVEGEAYAPRYALAPGAVDASAWIQFMGSAAAAVLRPQEVREISYVVQIPSTAKPGGYAAAVFVTSRPELPEGAIVVHDRVSVPQYITVKGEMQSSGTAQAGSLPGVLWGGTLQLPYTVTNTGEGHFTAKVTATVKTLWGATVYERSDERYVLPGTERRIKLEWQPDMVLGIYKIEQSAEYLGTAQNLAASWVVVLHPDMLIGIVFVIVGAVWLLAVRRKKR